MNYKKSDWLPAGFIILLCGALFWRAATVQGIFYFGDIFRLHYPERAAFLRALAQRQLPLWSTNALAGYPLLAEGQFGPLYPINWFLLLLPIDIALNYYIIIHYIWAGIGMYWLARILGTSRGSSLLSGIIYMFSGFSIAHLNHLNILAVVSWLPILVGTWQLVLSRLSQGWRSVTGPMAGTIACLALTLLAGHPQMALLSIMLLLSYTAWQIVFPDQRPSRRVRNISTTIIALIAVLAIGTSIAAVQLLPSYELAQLSERAGGLDPQFFASFSLHPVYSLFFISPFLLGNPYPNLSVELVGYTGLLPLLLAFCAPLIGRGKKKLWFYVALSLVSLALALGRWNPFYILLLRVPLFNWFRVPARFLFLYTFAIALLAGMGADALTKRLPISPSSKRRRVFVVLIAPFLLATASLLKLESLLQLWRYLPLLLAIFSGGICLAALREKLKRTSFRSLCLLLTLVDLGAFSAVYNATYNATMSRAEFRAEPRSLNILQSDPDIYRIYTHEEIVPVLPVMRESFYPNIALLHNLQAINGYFPLIPQRWGRFSKDLSSRKLDMLNVKYFLIPQVLPVDEASEFYDLENPFAPTLVGRSATFSPIPVQAIIVESYASHSVDLADGYEAAEIILAGPDNQKETLALRIGLETAEWAYERSDVRAQIRHSLPPIARSWPARSGFPPEDHIGHIYRAEYSLKSPLTITNLTVNPKIPKAFLRIERIILVDSQGQEHLLSHLIGEDDYTLVYRSEDVAIYQNHDVLPRAYLVHRASIIPNPALAAEAVEDAAFDPRSEVILETGIPLNGTSAGNEDNVEILAYASHHVTLHVSSQQAAYLVLSDAFYPGWQATVDGAPVPIHCANGIFRAIYLAKGDHLIEFSYRPPAFFWGILISSSALVAWVALIVWHKLAPDQNGNG